MFSLLPSKSRNGNGNGSEYSIEVRDVVKTVKTVAGPFTALKTVSLRVNHGEFVAVIGKSGSGQSTLLSMITGIDHPTAGEVYIDHTMVHDRGESRQARYPHQHPRESGVRVVTSDDDAALVACRKAAQSFPQAVSAVNELLGKAADFGLLLGWLICHSVFRPSGNSTVDGTNPP